MPENDEIVIPRPAGAQGARQATVARPPCLRRLQRKPRDGGSDREACYLADEIKRLRDIIRKDGADTRVSGYNGQPVSMPEKTDLQRNQQLLLSMLKAIRVDDDGDKLTRSHLGVMGADARWRNR